MCACANVGNAVYILSARPDVVAHWVQEGRVDVNDESVGFSILQEATCWGEVDLVRDCLYAGGDPDRKNGKGVSCRSAALGKPEILQLLEELMTWGIKGGE